MVCYLPRDMCGRVSEVKGLGNCTRAVVSTTTRPALLGDVSWICFAVVPFLLSAADAFKSLL